MSRKRPNPDISLTELLENPIVVRATNSRNIAQYKDSIGIDRFSSLVSSSALSLASEFGETRATEVLSNLSSKDEDRRVVAAMELARREKQKPDNPLVTKTVAAAQRIQFERLEKEGVDPKSVRETKDHYEKRYTDYSLKTQLAKSKDYRSYQGEASVPQMQNILSMEDVISSCLTSKKMTEHHKLQLKGTVDAILYNENKKTTGKADRPKNLDLINKHIGGIIRDEMKSKGVKVDSGIKQFWSDIKASITGERDKAKKAIKEMGFDVSEFVDKHAKKTPSTAIATPAGKAKQRGKADAGISEWR